MTTPEDKHNPTRNGHCSGCTDPRSEGTHQMGTFEHPDEAPKDKSQAEILAEKEIPWDQATTDALGLSYDGVYNTRDIARAGFVKGYAAAQAAQAPSSSAEQRVEDVVVSIELFNGKWHAQFTVGNQTFKLRPLHMDRLKGPGEKDAKWQADMLRHAFGGLRLAPYVQHKKECLRLQGIAGGYDEHELPACTCGLAQALEAQEAG